MFSIARVASAQTAVSASAAARSLHASAAASSELYRGVCKWFNGQKGFGFITPENGEPDVFVHHSNIKASGFRTLMDGEPVEFKIETDANGKLAAVEVSGPGGAPVKGRPRPAMRQVRESRGYGDDYGESHPRRERSEY